jgi:hypothetical protein
VGLASYDARDPEATFRPIEPPRPVRVPRRPPAVVWPLLVVVAWVGEIVALVAAGMLVTAVGATDPLVYVEWGAGFGATSAALYLLARFRGPLAARLRLPRRRLAFDRLPGWGRDLAGLAGFALLALVTDVALIWTMTMIAPPSHAIGPFDVARAGAVMWIANLPLGMLLQRRPGRAQEERGAG